MVYTIVSSLSKYIGDLKDEYTFDLETGIIQGQGHKYKQGKLVWIGGEEWGKSSLS